MFRQRLPGHSGVQLLQLRRRHRGNRQVDDALERLDLLRRHRHPPITNRRACPADRPSSPTATAPARPAPAPPPASRRGNNRDAGRSEEHTSELQSLLRISYAVFCLKKKKQHHTTIS